MYLGWAAAGLGRAPTEPDPDRYARHCRWLLDNGCSGLAVFGTNSEANSLSADERVDLLDLQ